MNQHKTKRVLNGSTWIWVVDEEAITNTQSNVDFYQNLVNSYENMITDANNQISKLK